MHLNIDSNLCNGCGLCVSVCIRENLKVDEIAVELDSGLCFDCGHCMAVCTKGAITLKKYEDMQDEIEEYRQRDVPVSYDDMLQFYKQRRSMRWFKDKKIDRETFDKLFESVFNSPTAENAQDVEFIVINDEKRLNDFMHLVYDIIKVREDEFFRIERLRDYLENPEDFEFHPLLWGGSQLVLGFAKQPINAVIATTRLELMAYTMGLGGFYSLWMLMADEIDHEKLMEFFPEVDKEKHMASTFIIGYPKKVYRRTIPRDKVKVTYI